MDHGNVRFQPIADIGPSGQNGGRQGGGKMRVRRIALLSVAAIVVASALSLMFKGSVVLLDPHRAVASAQVIDGWGQRQNLTSVGIAYVGVPRIEGTLEIRCIDGKVSRGGYVTPGAQMWERMGQKDDCSPW